MIILVLVYVEQSWQIRSQFTKCIISFHMTHLSKVKDCDFGPHTIILSDI